MDTIKDKLRDALTEKEIDDLTVMNLCEDIIGIDENIKKFISAFTKNIKGNHKTAYVPKIDLMILLAILTFKLKLSWDIHPQEKIKDMALVEINEKPERLH